MNTITNPIEQKIIEATAIATEVTPEVAPVVEKPAKVTKRKTTTKRKARKYKLGAHRNMDIDWNIPHKDSHKRGTCTITMPWGSFILSKREARSLHTRLGKGLA